ncbi:hypothetical protein KCV07_g377, partial [Aureobasidium melanogenum]
MQDSGEASAWPIASVVRALLLLPLVLIAVVDSRYRCHDCRGSCRDDPSPVEPLVRILLILQSQVSKNAGGVVLYITSFTGRTSDRVKGVLSFPPSSILKTSLKNAFACGTCDGMKPDFMDRIVGLGKGLL